MTRHSSKVQRVHIVSYETACEKIKEDIKYFVTEGETDAFFESRSYQASKEEVAEGKQRLRDKIQCVIQLQRRAKVEPVFYERLCDVPFSLASEFENYKNGLTGKFLLFHDYLYQVPGPLTEQECKLLVFQEFDRERKYYEKLHSIYVDGIESSSKTHRERIPEKVRISVWRRDGGQCARCGSREKLEYDHIIPISKGGGNTVRNIELLCETHNRSKGDQIK